MYDTFRTVNDAKNAYKRCRKTKCFILEGDEKELSKIKCSRCGKPLNEFGDTPKGYRGNRCDYKPKTKSVIGMHYTCAWRQTLSEVANFEH